MFDDRLKYTIQSRKMMSLVGFFQLRMKYYILSSIHIGLTHIYLCVIHERRRRREKKNTRIK